MHLMSFTHTWCHEEAGRKPWLPCSIFDFSAQVILFKIKHSTLFRLLGNSSDLTLTTFRVCSSYVHRTSSFLPMQTVANVNQDTGEAINP